MRIQEKRLEAGFRGVERHLAGLVESIKRRRHDFSALYVSVSELHSFCLSHPPLVSEDTIATLREVLEWPEHTSQKQSPFLYREAAVALADISACDGADKAVTECAARHLKEAISKVFGPARRAAAEAMGSLPVWVRGVAPRGRLPRQIPSIKWENLLRTAGISVGLEPKMVGRSLTFPIEGNGVFAVKLAYAHDPLDSLHREALWMDHLAGSSLPFSESFHVPKPVPVEGNYVFRIENPPCSGCNGMTLHPQGFAIGFLTRWDYFVYVNDHRKDVQLGKEELRDALFRNARFLGALTSSGILHSAPIPLFHNRVQRSRRSDEGLYEWHRGGRLDRWLQSCRYPNFGLSGIRDFEHLVAYDGNGGTKLYRQIGSHMLSLILVAGSYFRNLEPDRVGFDKNGGPVDARDLFDKPFLAKLLKGIFLSYYQGYVGREFSGDLSFDMDHLASRMVDEMGVDKHMEEILRAVDQRKMTRGEFTGFLLSGGYSEREAQCMKRGVADIIVHTGPHLGGFNDRISLPEATEFIAIISALCISGKFESGKFPIVERATDPEGPFRR